MNADVAVIVVAYNSARYRRRLLDALAAQTHRAWWLILIDNASRPNERPSVAELPRTAVLHQLEANIGFAAANNLAAREAQTPFIATLNPDAFPEPSWLEELLAAAARYPHAAAFGATQISAEDPALLDGVGDAMHIFGIPYRAGFHRPRAAQSLQEGETFSVCAAAALYRREVFLHQGGFDESFFAYVEDVDLGYRLRLAGWSCIQAPKAVVAHVGGGSSEGKNAFADFHGARNRLWCFVKNTPPLLFWPLFPWHIAATVFFLLRQRLEGRGEAGAQGFHAALKQWPDMWRARTAVQARRKASAVALARLMVFSPFALRRRAPKIMPVR